MKRNLLRLVFMLFAGILLTACGGNKGLTSRNMAHLYQQDGVLMRPEYYVINTSPFESELHYRLLAHELLYMKPTEGEIYTADVRIRVRLYSSLENPVLLDSASIRFTDEQLKMEDIVLEGVIPFKTPEAQRYVLDVQLQDLNRDYTHQNYVDFRKTTLDSRNYFSLHQTNGELMFEPVVKLNTPFLIKSTNTQLDSVWVRVYHRQFPLSSPPYVIENDMAFDYTADSLYYAALTDTFSFSKPGFYHFQKDTTTTEGFTTFCYYQHFPYVTQVDHLAPPMRYITTKKEFQALTSKKAVDAFWIKNAGTPDRAKMLIRTYYNRVEDANSFFTSYTEGWRTDRGIVYTIFGPPNIIYKTASSESWIYGEENSMLSYNFNFVRVQNPFSSNDYALNRSSIYRYSWSQAVDTWRQGRIFNVSDVQRAQDESERQYSRPYFWY
jgi:GWxTD domain-containing protein